MTYPNINSTGEITGLLNFFTYSNNVTDGFFGMVVIILIFFVSFVALKNYTTERALATSGFVTCFMAILFTYMGLLSTTMLIPVVILSALTVFPLLGGTS